MITEESIQTAFDAEKVSFADEEDAVYAPAITLWASLSQVLFIPSSAPFVIRNFVQARMPSRCARIIRAKAMKGFRREWLAHHSQCSKCFFRT